MSATNSLPQSCPRCSFTLPRDARFCPKCGQRILTDDTAELPVDPALHQVRSEEAEVPLAVGDRPRTSVHRIERRPLGLSPISLLGGLTAGALILGIILVAAVAAVPGIVVLLLAAILFAFFIPGLRRQPDSPLAQRLGAGGVRARDLVGFLLVWGRTWGRTGHEVALLRWRRARLERELRRRMTPLGEAVLQHDSVQIEALKAEAAELQRQLDEAERRKAAAMTRAQAQVERERAPVQPTQVLTPVSPSGPETRDSSAQSPAPETRDRPVDASGDRSAGSPDAGTQAPSSEHSPSATI